MIKNGLFTPEYFLDQLNRYMKHQIQMYIHIHNSRNTTEEEYKEYFERWKSLMKCEVNKFDLGMYDE